MSSPTDVGFNTVAVIGSGVMGAAIAAHLANAGVGCVYLFDQATDEEDRSQLAKTAIHKLKKADPAPLTHPRNAKAIHPANLEDDLALLANCDLVIEAVIERLEIKQALYKKLFPHLKAGAVIASNTSTIPLHKLASGLSANARARLIILHFFNPPRYMPLVEWVAPSEFDLETQSRLIAFLDHRMGKQVLICKDTPGFIANRLGIYWVMRALQQAVDQGLAIEDADAVLSKPLGIPKTGVFGLMDVVGLDLMPPLLQAISSALPPEDALVKLIRPEPIIDHLLEQGLTGRKAKGGFYRLKPLGDGTKEKQAIDLASFQYRPKRKSELESARLSPNQLAVLLTHKDAGGAYARSVILPFLCYCLNLLGEISNNPSDIDQALMLGYRWQYGPFALIEKIGIKELHRLLEAEGLAIPETLATLSTKMIYRPNVQPLGKELDGKLELATIRRNSEPLLANPSARVWDIGDGVGCFELTSPMNSLDQDNLGLLDKTVREADRLGVEALVIYNEGEHFCVGANLGIALFMANIAAWGEIDNLIRYGQRCFSNLRYAPIPVIAAPSGLALGGGCELLLHCDAVEAHIETYIGLVEVGVGIVPAWGGCTRMLERWQANPKHPKGVMPSVMKVFELIGTAYIAKSAELAKQALFLRPDDGVVFNRQRLLYQAKQRALTMKETYQPPEPAELLVGGESAALSLIMAVDHYQKIGKATPHDVTILTALANVLSGGKDADPLDKAPESALLALEHHAITQLIRTPATLARMEHMLETSKPLRN